MQDLAPQAIPQPLIWAFVVAIMAAAVVWSWVAERLQRGLPVLAYEPRRQVPWQAIDLALVLLIYGIGLMLMFHLGTVWFGPEAGQPAEIQNVDQANTAHMVARVLSEGSVWTLLLCGLTAAVAAPIIEEFLFRVLLQGWLERVALPLRRLTPTLRRWLPRGIGPVALTSLLFARMHFRVDTPQMDVEFLTFAMVGNAVVGLLTVALAVGLIWYRTGAVAVDFGFVRQKFFADVALGLAAFIAIATPIYLMQVGLSVLLPSYVAADPITLFFFALVLGLLYYRTHRIVASVVLHMALNATSLAMAWLLLGR